MGSIFLSLLIDDPYSAIRAISHPPKEKPGFFDDATAQALSNYQKYHGLPVTGMLDEATVVQMSIPRCGVPDIPYKGSLAYFVDSGIKWNHTNLTYDLRNFTADLTNQQIANAVVTAFDLWMAETPLTFTRVAGFPHNADIDIEFATGIHSDGYSFDGPGGVWTHAFYPAEVTRTEVHFDDDENWTVLIPVPAGGIDLVTTAAHEFGHSLGLMHSNVRGTLMFPTQSQPHHFLTNDDINGIHSIYGGRPRLGMNIYGATDGGYTTIHGSGGTGQGLGARAWLTGDVNGDGKDEIMQLRNY
jgi:predicted Zn-dependent protease